MKLIEETGDEELLLELNTLSMKSRISRLEEMFYQCGKYINELANETNEKMEILLTDTLKNSYYEDIYNKSITSVFRNMNIVNRYKFSKISILFIQ